MFKSTAFSFALLANAVSAEAESATKGLELAPGFNFDAKYNNITSNIDMTFVVPDNTWFGVVLGAQDMWNSNMVQVVADGDNSKVLDLHSTKPGMQPG